MNKIIDRIQAPTPTFFKILRTIGLSVAAVGGTLLATPVALPAIVLTVAGYLTVAGSVIGVISQTAVDNE